MREINYKGKEAAMKAVNTLRLNRLANVDQKKIIELSDEITAMEFAIDDDFSRDGIIAREVDRTTWKSFCRFGSRRNATAALILHWIRNDSKILPLDEQAMHISNQYGMEIFPDELAEFIMMYDRGKSFYEPYRKLAELKQTFKDITGFHYNRKWLKQNFLLAPVSDDNPF